MGFVANLSKPRAKFIMSFEFVFNHIISLCFLQGTFLGIYKKLNASYR
jgi:hypothetical protein